MLSKYELEDAICDFCNSPEREVIFNKKGLLCEHLFNVVKCKECGLVYVSPRLTSESVSKLYDITYYGSEEIEGVDDYWNNQKIRSDKAEYIFNIINSVRPFKKEDRILDVGCGKGDLIKYLNSKGYKAEGVEKSEFACVQLKKQGIVCHQGDIFSQYLESRKFDVIVSTDVIEHVYSPMDFLKKAYSLIDSRGIFLCTTDMADYFFDKDGVAWEQLTPDVHIYYFSLNSFQKYFRGCGFVAADQYNYYINYKRNINKLLNLIGLLKNIHPTTKFEKWWCRYILQSIDHVKQKLNKKTMKLWNIPLMKKDDL